MGLGLGDVGGRSFGHGRLVWTVGEGGTVESSTSLQEGDFEASVSFVSLGADSPSE